MDAATIDKAVRQVLADAWDIAPDEIVLEAVRSDGTLAFTDALAAVEGSQAMQPAAAAVEPIEMWSVTVVEPRLATVAVFFDATGTLVAASLLDDYSA